MIDIRNIQKIVKAEMAQRFPKAHVVDVYVESREDGEEDMTIDVKVILEAKKGDFDPTKIPDFLTAITPKIMAARQDPFPVFSFISKSEWGNRKPAAA